MRTKRKSGGIMDKNAHTMGQIQEWCEHLDLTFTKESKPYEEVDANGWTWKGTHVWYELRHDRTVLLVLPTYKDLELALFFIHGYRSGKQAQ